MPRYVDAVVVAREFYGANGHILNTTPIGVNPLIRDAVIKRAKTYSEITNVAKLKIKVVPAGGGKVASILLCVENSPEHINPLLKTGAIDVPYVILAANLTPCWQRFALCRELVGIYMDLSSPVKSQNPKVKYKAELESIAKSFYDLNKEDDLDVEWFNFALTVEIMLPWKDRTTLHNMKDVQKLTNYAIANNFKVPEDVIELYFEYYRTISVEANEGLQ
ncbi:hypothetical protein [Mariprofundus ferrooxydans]|uniref:hypothetical protein n=1 Tax=Mariprofundus ferrooxydans TaxID=314344 RepID=UPI001430C5B0|nr:hypothetical protein [Mariprofundus ferrooxydans]